MKTGFACGVFDLFHAGHVLMLKECREQCDHLIVALNSSEQFDSSINPGKKSPIYSLEERILIMKSIRYVDEVLVYHNEVELKSILEARKIDVRFLGEDYLGKQITGEELGIPIHYVSRSHGLSTSLYRRKMEGDSN